jgi:DNA polymerase-3 subunit epsilon
LATGEAYHQYVNPERDMPKGAFAVHGLSAEFLVGYPVFQDIADAFIEFIGDAPLVIHNAQFDMGFINAELARIARPSVPMDRSVDTVRMARKKFPFAQVSLNALCRRFQIDNSGRELHGALLDAELLAEVYLELIGGRQPDLVLSGKPVKVVETHINDAIKTEASLEARPHGLRRDELAAHQSFIDGLKNPIWRGTAKESSA